MTVIPGVLADGTWVDNFRVVRRLGRGGFGVTYLAEEFREWETGTDGGDTGMPLRQVAIKEFFPRGLASRSEGNTVTVSLEVEGADQGFQMALKGFFQEAESLMRFDHPNVIKIYRVFQRNGTAYFVMPYLRGESLKAILKREGALSEARTRELLMPVMDGLIHAHARGILHRDLKPDNVMVPDEGVAVLIDFGAARAQVLDDAPEYTRHSELVAYSPGYAALEQYGRATRDNPHGPQTDVYGMAAVMYHAVTGKAPAEASQRSMQLTTGGQDPLVPASIALADAPGISRSFLAGLDWGLELAGKNRPQSLDAFRAALDGKAEIPLATRERLEARGVDLDRLTRPLPGQLDAALVSQAPGDEPEDETVLFSRPATSSVPSVPTAGKPLSSPAPGDSDATRLNTPSTSTSRPTQPLPRAQSGLSGGAIPLDMPVVSQRAPPERARSGLRWFPWLALLAALAGLWVLGRDQVEEQLRQHLPEPVKAKLPAEVIEYLNLDAAPIGQVSPEQALPDESELSHAESAAPAADAEREAYEAAKQVNTLESWEAFKGAFPNSKLITTADIRIAALRAEDEAQTKLEAERLAAAEARAKAEADEAARVAAEKAQARDKAEAERAAREVAAAKAKAEAARKAKLEAEAKARAAEAEARAAKEKIAAEAERVKKADPVPPQPEPRTEVVTPKTGEGGMRDCSGCPEIVRIAGGSFDMGDVSGNGEGDEQPIRRIQIKSFYAGRYEVTFDEWNSCAASGACRRNPSDGNFGRGRRPVINVSWHDAQKYVSWLSSRSGKRYRLPTEAEMEYLHRAGARTAYPWGDSDSAACIYANVADLQAKRRKPEWSVFNCDDRYAYTAPVGSYRANRFGLFDVAGNVWEWTQDCYTSYRSAPSDGSAYDPPGCSRRVVRGGSWSDATRNQRSADRTASPANSTLNIVGFRVIRD